MELKNILSLPKSTMLNKKDYDSIVDKIPVNPIATKEVIASLKKVPEGETPLDLIFAVKFEQSKNNRQYSIEAYKSIVEKILTSDVFIPVCYGHQSKNNVSWEGRKIVGSVIGAFLDDVSKIVYYRIIPDASKNNEDIRRWIRNKQINAVSIWGFSDGVENEEGIEIIKDFLLLSIDFVPPLSEGQENISLVIGEANNQLNNRIIYNPKKYKEFNMADEKIKIEDVSNENLYGEMTKRLKDGRLSLKALAGELNCHVLTGEERQEEEEEKEMLKRELSSLLERAKQLGFKNVDELFDYTKDVLKKFEDEKTQNSFNTLKTEVLNEMGIFKDGKPAHNKGALIARYAPVKQGMNREEIKEVFQKMLDDKELQALEGVGNVGGESINIKGEMLNGQTSTSRTEEIEVFEI